MTYSNEALIMRRVIIGIGVAIALVGVAIAFSSTSSTTTNATTKSAATTTATTPSFSCQQVKFKDDRTICNNDNLGTLELTATIAFEFARSISSKKTKAQARSFIKERRACKEDVDCIADVLERSTEAFQEIMRGAL